MTKDRRKSAVSIACVIGSATLQALIPTPGLTLLGWDCKPETTTASAPHQPLGTYWDVRTHRDEPYYAPGDAPATPPPPHPVSQAPVNRAAMAATAVPARGGSVASNADTGPLDVNGNPTNPNWYYTHVPDPPDDGRVCTTGATGGTFCSAPSDSGSERL